MRITVHQRGGASVYGGSYDPKRAACIIADSQQRTVTIDWPSTITAVTISQDGISAGTPTITDNQSTFTTSGTGRLEIVATMGSERPKVVIEAEASSRTDYAG